LLFAKGDFYCKRAPLRRLLPGKERAFEKSKQNFAAKKAIITLLLTRRHNSAIIHKLLNGRQSLLEAGLRAKSPKGGA
jgi:hypothetical protein